MREDIVIKSHVKARVAQLEATQQGGQLHNSRHEQKHPDQMTMVREAIERLMLGNILHLLSFYYMQI